MNLGGTSTPLERGNFRMVVGSKLSCSTLKKKKRTFKTSPSSLNLYHFFNAHDSGYSTFSQKQHEAGDTNLQM